MTILILHAPRAQHDPIVRELITPVAREIGTRTDLDALFFARYNKPDWHLRFGILGRPDWVDGPVRDLLEGRLDALRERGLLARHEFGAYEPEVDRYGGEEGLRLAERIFHHDTLACLDLMDAEARGRTAKSRREYCLILTERFLDLMRFTREHRIVFYRHSYSFQIDLGRWQTEELDALDRHYRSVKDGLLELFRGETSRDPEQLWGGVEPARIAGTCLDALAPLVEELLRAHAAGRIRQNRVDLAWSLTHMHANRLQVEADAESIVRYFMHRLHEEERIGA